MASMIRRTTLREIKHSLGRYLAIMAIVALGVAFFAGLKITKPCMVATVDKFYAENKFYDYKLISIVGFEEEDVEQIAENSPELVVEGSYTADAMYLTANGSESVLKFHSVTEGVNQLVVTAGRMPEAPNECVVDDLVMGEDSIGKTLTLSENNPEDTLDMFATTEYTVVGVVRSPIYINFERGTTSLGTGRISGFAYLLPEGFDSDTYTEVYVRMNEVYELYSDEYEAAIDATRDEITDITESVVTARINQIRKDAEEEIADGEQELADSKAEAEQEFADAMQELQEAQAAVSAMKTQLELTEYAYGGFSDMGSLKEQIDNGYEELEKAEKELNDGYREYIDNYAEYLSEIADAEQEIADAKEQLTKLDGTGYYVLERTSNVAYSCFDSDASICDGIANVFPIFFFLVAALVCITTMTRMIDEQRTQIGVLKALGYSEHTIMGKYMFYSGSAALSGALIGYFGGCRLFPYVIWIAYQMMYNVADLVFVTDWKLATISLAVSLLCSMGATWVSCHHELRSVAAQLIRPKAPKGGKRIFLEYVPFIWKRMSFLKKVSIRNVFRYKKRFFMMVLGISGCTALLLTGFGVQNSVVDIANLQYDNIQTYDMTLTLTNEEDSEAVNIIESYVGKGVESYALSYETSMDMSMVADGKEQIKSVSVIIPDDVTSAGEFLHLQTPKGEALDFPDEGEIVVAQKLADTYKLKVGDKVTLADDDQNRMELTISGICKNYVYNYVYVSRESYLQEVADTLPWKTVYLNVQEETDIHELSAEFLSNDKFATSMIVSDIEERINNMMKSMDYIVLLIIICAASLAFIVLYNLTNINITERIREIATIKVLGFYPGETAGYVFRENTILTAVGAVVGQLLGIWLHSFVMDNIKVDMVSFDVRILPISYVYSIVLTFVFAALVNIVMYVKLGKINMAESLKSVE